MCVCLCMKGYLIVYKVYIVGEAVFSDFKVLELF